MNKQQVPMDLIVLDAGTQQRPIDNEIVQEYVDLIKDGVELPPIEIIRDGDNFYLWDGFHRIECYQKLNKKKVFAFITAGSANDAIWASFGANREHGARRTRGIMKQIVKTILCDKRWSKKSQKAIAKHVGCTQPYVSMVKDEIVAEQKKKPDSKTEKAEKGITTDTLQRDDKVEVTSSTGKTYEQKSQETQKKKRKPMKDGAGQEIPEHLEELYQSKSTIRGLMTRLKNIFDEVNEAVEKRDPTFTFLNPNALKVNYSNMRRTLSSSLFYAVCCYCGGRGTRCKGCHGTGLLSRFHYNAANSELKTPKKKAKKKGSQK